MAAGVDRGSSLLELRTYPRKESLVSKRQIGFLIFISYDFTLDLLDLRYFPKSTYTSWRFSKEMSIAKYTFFSFRFLCRNSFEVLHSLCYCWMAICSTSLKMYQGRIGPDTSDSRLLKAHSTQRNKSKTLLGSDVLWLSVWKCVRHILLLNNSLSILWSSDVLCPRIYT